MIQIFTRILAVLLGCALLSSCGSGERRVEGEMAFDSDSLMNMAESFLQAGDYGNAMRLYQRAANENPRHIPSRLGLAKTYQALGASDAAINFYDQVLRLDPNNMAAKLGTGQMLITRNRPGDAIPYLTELSKQDPTNYRIYNMLGLAHDLMGEQEEAQMNYSRGLDLAPDNISLLNNLALSLAFEEQYAPSIKLLSKAINLDYTATKAQQNLVLVYVLSGEEGAGRKIGESLMTVEEMENNIRLYRWVRSLNSGQRAQAIFLGIRNFPKQEKEPARAEKDNIPDDPKKRKLLALLRQEDKLRDQKQEKVSQTEQGVAARPEKAEKVEKRAPKALAADTPPQKVYRVQLGSYPNTDIAHIGWQKLKRLSKGILDSYAPLIKRVTLAGGRNVFRLYVGGIEDKAMARTVCDQLGESNVDCLVLRTAKN